MKKDSINLWISLEPPSGAHGLFHRFAALGEALFVLLALILIARALIGALGFQSADSFLMTEGRAPDFRAAAMAEGLWHFVRYGLIFVVIFLVGWARRRRSPEAYALTTGGRSVFHLIAFGIGLFAVMHIPSLGLRLVDNVIDIGPGTPFWWLMKTVEWNRDFWLYMAVSSFLVVPFVEEIVARGYMLGRSRESFSQGAALRVSALIFVVVAVLRADEAGTPGCEPCAGGCLLLGSWRTSALRAVRFCKALMSFSQTEKRRALCRARRKYRRGKKT